MAQIRGWLDNGAPGPHVASLGPGFLTPGGYLSRLADGHRIASVADVEPHFALLEELGVAGIKVPLEKGFGPAEVWPIHSQEIREAIAAGARARGLPIYVHGTAEDEQRLALEMGAHALVHTGFENAAPTAEFVEALRASGAYVMTTFAIFDAPLIRFEPERLDAPLIQRVVPRVQIDTARDPASGERLAERQIEMSMPGAPGFVHSLIAWLVLGERGIRERLASTLAAATLFHEAGVPVVVGTDSGNWSIVPYQFHGPTTIREIELLGEAGWSFDQALAAATELPARMLGLEAEIGRVAVGMRADLVILGADPMADLGALRDVRYTIKAGDARTPEQWMARAASH